MNDQPWYDIGLESGRLEEEEHGWAPGSKRWAGENYGWQSLESYNKLYTQGKLNETQQQIDRLVSPITKPLVQAATDFYQNDPVIGPTLRSIGGGISLTFQSAPKPVQEKITEVAQLPQTAAENIAAATGLPVSLTDPFLITDVATAGASALASKGLRQTVKTAVKGLVNDVRTPPTGLAPAVAGAAPTPTTPRFEIDRGVVRIVTVPERQWATATRKAGGEVASVPQYADALKARTKTIRQAETRIPEWAEQVRLAEEAVAANRTRATLKDLKYAKGKLKTARDDLSRAISTLRTQDEHFFAWGWLQKKPDQLGFRKPDLIGGQWEKHHLFHKGESTEIYNRLEELILDGKATTDDLVNMMLRAREQGAATGDAFTNLILSHKKGSHSPYHASRITDPVGIRGLPAQPSRKQLREVLSKLNSAEELQDFMDEYIEKVVLPGKQKMFKMELDYRKASGNYDVEDLIEGIREGL